MRKIAMLSISLASASLLCAAFLASPAHGAQDCKAVHWPYSNEAKNFEPKALEKVARPSLYAYLYYELAVPKAQRTPDLAKKLFFYLSSTELNEGRLNLIQALQTSAELDSAQPTIIPTAEICGIEARLPSSLKKKNQAKSTAKSAGPDATKTLAKPGAKK